MKENLNNENKWRNNWKDISIIVNHWRSCLIDTSGVDRIYVAGDDITKVFFFTDANYTSIVLKQTLTSIFNSYFLTNKISIMNDGSYHQASITHNSVFWIVCLYGHNGKIHPS